MGVDREAVSCASGLNWCSFILILFATCSSYWSWGVGIAENGVQATASSGPWVASQVWSSFGVPCNCQTYPPYYCYSLCYVTTPQVLWLELTPELACGPLSQVYLKWSGPLNYCTFPPNFTLPTVPDVGTLPDNSTGWDLPGGVPAGTTFTVPSQIISVQALMVIACVAIFFASVLGCADALSESGARRKSVGASAFCCSLIGWVFCLSAYCVFTGIEYVQRLQATPPTIGMPMFSSEGTLSAITVTDAVYGPGFGTAITTSILTFLASLIHLAAMKTGVRSDAPSGGATASKEAPEPTPAAQEAPPVVVEASVAKV